MSATHQPTNTNSTTITNLIKRGGPCFSRKVSLGGEPQGLGAGALTRSLLILMATPGSGIQRDYPPPRIITIIKFIVVYPIFPLVDSSFPYR
jgi:hypothetical protein